MEILYFRQTRPNKKSDRARWNESWEHDLDISYGNVGRAVPSLKTSREASQFFKRLQAESSSSIAKEAGAICHLQDDLAKLALEKISTDDFEDKWTELTRARRDELVLEAFYEASCAGPDMEGHRKWCPDMTIKYLAGDGGQRFLDLLSQYWSDEQGDRKSPKLIPHSAVDKLFMLEPWCNNASQLHLHRSYFMTMAMWRVLLAFYGIEERYMMVKAPRGSAQNSFKGLQDVSRVLGKDGPRVIRDIRKELKRQEAEQVPICWNCGKTAKQLGLAQGLKACQACKKIDRIILYCSRECQKTDWKNETKEPHKIICGKRPQIPKESSLTSQANDMIPVPDDSFKRSPALVHEISFLKRPPYFDYIFVVPAPDPDIGVNVSPDQNRILFLTMRQRALKNGDRNAVCTMFRFLVPLAKEKNVAVSELKKQLEKEYRVTIDPNNREMEMPTATEVNRAKELVEMSHLCRLEQAMKLLM